MQKGLFFSCLLSLALLGCGGANQNANENPSQASQAVEQEVAAKTLEPVYVLSDQFGEKFFYYPVQLNGAQLENEAENNYRDTYYNFDNLPGWLYQMQGGRLLEHPLNEYDAIWGAALLVDENYKNTSKILELKNRKDGSINIVSVSDDVQNKLKEKYGRNILTACASAVFGDNSEYQLVNVQFENKGTEALGVTALVENGEIKAVKEFPATYDEMSTWRVDDEGEFGGLWADLVVLENGVLTLYTVDNGAEGSNYQSYVVKGDALCEGNVSTSLYQAPM